MIEVSAKEDFYSLVMNVSTAAECLEVANAMKEWIEKHPEDKEWIEPLGSTLAMKYAPLSIFT